MFLDRSVPRISRDWERFAFVHEGKVELRGLIQTAIDSGQLPATAEPESILRVLLTSIVGAAVVRLCDRLSPGEDADALAETRSRPRSRVCVPGSIRRSIRDDARRTP